MRRRTETLIVVVAAMASIVLIWAGFGNSWHQDLSALYFAARSYGLGQTELIYLAPDRFFGAVASPEWQDMALQLGHGDELVLPYVYAPLWAAVLAPLAVRLDPIAFYNLVLVVHIGFFLWSILLARRIAAQGSAPLWAWFGIAALIALVSTPFLNAFWHNQPQITVTFLVLLAFERYRAGAWRTAGIALGLAAAIKITPAILAVIFLMDRHWRAAGVAAATGLGLLVLSLAVAGLPLHIAFWEQLQRASAYMVLTPLNLGLEAVIARWGEVISGGLGYGMEDKALTVVESGGWGGLLSMAVLILGLALIWRVTRGAGQPVYPRLLALWALVILCGPLAWNHYLIGPLFLLPGVLWHLPRRLAAPALVMTVLAVSLPLQSLLLAGQIDPVWLMTLGAASLCAMFWLAILSVSPEK